MKYRLPSLFLVSLSVSVSISTKAQQEYTLVTSAANIISAKALIDLPGLSGATGAIIIATPMGNTSTLNPHPIGAWYYSGKWNIFNSDYGAMIPGLTYKITYYLNPGSNQFLHLVTQQNLGAEGSYIDHPALNNKPNAQLTIFQNHAPDIRPGSWLNPHKASAGYSSSSGRWFIANISGQPIQKGCAYNVVISESGSTSIINPGPVKTVTGATPDCKCPASLPPNGQASGDLAGTYPGPTVGKILGRPVSSIAPQPGQVLKWTGNEWSPSNDATYTPAQGSSGTSYTAGTGILINGNELSAQNNEPVWNAIKIRGTPVAQTVPKPGQVLTYSGNSWYPSDPAVNFSTGIGLKMEDNQLSVLNTNPLWNAGKITGREVATTAPTVGQVLKWSGSVWHPADEEGLSADSAFKRIEMRTSPGPSSPSNNATRITGLIFYSYLNTTAKYLVSFNVPAHRGMCVGCQTSHVEIQITVNGVVQRRFWWDIAPYSSTHFSASHLLELPGGTNIFELKASVSGGPVDLGSLVSPPNMIVQTFAK